MGESDEVPGDATVVEPARARLDAINTGRTVRCEVLGPQPTGPGELAGVAPRPRLEDEGEIARGGMSSVRRAFDTRILRHVAMKVLDPKCAAQPGAALRFLEEAQITGQLDHPNIAPVYDLGLSSEGPEFFTMKLVSGATLSQILRGDVPAPPSRRTGSSSTEVAPITSRPEALLQAARLERLLRVFLKVCDAVSFAHSRGVIHRDLKPDNVMIGDHGQVYVMDWGVAMLREGTRPSESNRLPEPGVRRDPDHHVEDRPGSVIGTASYMAPEQAWGRVHEIDERTDVFGLGAILYRILTGHAPNRLPDRGDPIVQARNAQVPHPSEVAPHDLPPGLCRIVMKALAPRREDRHASVDELEDEVEDFLLGGGWFATRTFAAGAVVVAEGDVGHVAYIIQRGRCEIRRTVDGVETALRQLGPGDVFGEAAILTDRPRNATVVALEPVSALVVTRESLEHELDRNAWLALIVRALAERFRELDARLTGAGG